MIEYMVLVIFLLQIFKDVRATESLQIRNSGIQHIDRLDVGMIFFIEVKNEGKSPVALNVRMIKCCEKICDDDIDCEHMQLIGGDMGVLTQHGVRNLTLIWPTLYLHDRVGECNIRISYTWKNNQTGEIRQKVEFDTIVSRRYVPAILEGYYDPLGVESCSTVDLDSLDSCRPVNCHIKYSGKRNFFNRKLLRCQEVPICIADSSKELPDVGYVPASNTCRDLENAVNEMEVRALSRGDAEPAWRSEIVPHIANMYCHHGYSDNATGFCICDEGWTSHSLGNIEPTTEYIHMCNVQMLHFLGLHNRNIKFSLVIIAILLGVLAMMCVCAMFYVMKEFIPPCEKTECAQQTGHSSCFDGSSRSFTSYCSSKTKNGNSMRRPRISYPARH